MREGRGDEMEQEGGEETDGKERDRRRLRIGGKER